MKFMSRSVFREDDSGDEGPDRDIQWISHHGTGPRTVKIEESYVKVEDLCQLGRISSKAFNPYVEKLMAEFAARRAAGQEVELEEGEIEEMDGLSAAEVNRRYTKLMGKKKGKKRKDQTDEESGELSESSEEDKPLRKNKFRRPN
eukprot:sb/3473916/